MGIDLYARYSGQTPEEVERQRDNWLTPTCGELGYLREAYHGEPYATRFLVSEAFEIGEAAIPASVLRGRLPEALRIVELREHAVYPDTSQQEVQAMLDSYTAFVEYCERAERQSDEPVTIIASY